MYTASWEPRVKWITVAVFVLLGGLALAAAWNGRAVIGVIVPVGLLLVLLVFAVRGYSLTDTHLVVHHFGWSSKYRLDELTGVYADSSATIDSIRTMAIGGPFGFIGYFRNPALGQYLAYVTNVQNAVVLKFRGRTLVISPDNPDQFIADVRQRATVAVN